MSELSYDELTLFFPSPSLVICSPVYLYGAVWSRNMVSGGGRGDARREIESLVHSVFEAGKNKDLASLAGFYAPSELFTKFDDAPPYTRQNAQDAFMYEQAVFSNISDYDYTLEELRVDLVGERVAVATFYLTYKGVFVNDYSFEGRIVSSRSRVTMVLARFETGWKLVHEHFSSFPDLHAEVSPERGNSP